MVIIFIVLLDVGKTKNQLKQIQMYDIVLTDNKIYILIQKEFKNN